MAEEQGRGEAEPWEEEKGFWEGLGIQRRGVETGNRDRFGKRPKVGHSTFTEHLPCAGPWGHSPLLPGYSGVRAAWSPCSVACDPCASAASCVRCSHQAGQAALRPTPPQGQQVRGHAPRSSPCAPPRGITQSPPRPPMLSPSPGLVRRQHSRKKRPLPVATAGAPDKGQLGTQADLERLGQGARFSHLPGPSRDTPQTQPSASRLPAQSPADRANCHPALRGAEPLLP